jgi:hypothetical protein
MLIVSAHLCMAINLYKECRGASDKECQLINRVVINRIHDSAQDACSVIFQKNQFSWTRSLPKKLQFASYRTMIAYYKIKDSAQLIRAFYNVDKSQDKNSTLKTAANMIHFYDKSMSQPRWARNMTVAYRTKNFVFFNA